MSTFLNALTRPIFFSVSHNVLFSPKTGFFKTIRSKIHTLTSTEYLHKPQKIHLFNDTQRIRLSYLETNLTGQRIMVIHGIRSVVHRHEG